VVQCVVRRRPARASQHPSRASYTTPNTLFTMSNFYNKVSLAYTKPLNKRMTLQEISQANQWINGENGNTIVISVHVRKRFRGR